MSDFRDRFEEQLVHAAARLPREGAPAGAPARARQRLRWDLVMGLAVLVGVAVLAVALSASDGPERRRSSASGALATDAPPRDQLALLGVLRRSQTPFDRGLVTQHALEGMSYRVRAGFVRRLRAPDRWQVVLTSVPTYRPGGQLAPASLGWEIRDALCLRVAPPGSVAFSVFCFRAIDVRRGRAVGFWGPRRLGLVPDGVAQVAIHSPGGAVARVPVKDNFYSYRPPGAGREPPTGTWAELLDARGRPIRRGR